MAWCCKFSNLIYDRDCVEFFWNQFFILPTAFETQLGLFYIFNNLCSSPMLQMFSYLQWMIFSLTSMTNKPLFMREMSSISAAYGLQSIVARNTSAKQLCHKLPKCTWARHRRITNDTILEAKDNCFCYKYIVFISILPVLAVEGSSYLASTWPVSKLCLGERVKSTDFRLNCFVPTEIICS